MTITERTDLAVGTRVRITGRPYYQIGGRGEYGAKLFHDQGGEHATLKVGDVGEIKTHRDSSGDYMVAFDGYDTTTHVNENVIEVALAESPVVEAGDDAEVRPTRKGDRILLLDAVGINGLVREVNVGVALEDETNDGRVRFCFETDREEYPWDRAWYADEWTLLPAEGETAEEGKTRTVAELTVARSTTEEEREAAIVHLAIVKAERDRARTELEEFKTRVRDAVIAEAKAQGWCSRTDGWLEELGLAPRLKPYEGPTAVGSVIKLTDGRIAVICDTSSQPFRVGNLDGLDTWLSVQEVLEVGVDEVLHDNKSCYPDFIDID